MCQQLKCLQMKKLVLCDGCILFLQFSLPMCILSTAILYVKLLCCCLGSMVVYWFYKLYLDNLPLLICYRVSNWKWVEQERKDQQPRLKQIFSSLFVDDLLLSNWTLVLTIEVSHSDLLLLVLVVLLNLLYSCVCMLVICSFVLNNTTKL